MRHLMTLVCLFLVGTALAEDRIAEGTRKVPVAYDVDVLVVGGSTRGVAAAIAAQEAGASVFLMARRAYLGGDLCATYRFLLKDVAPPAEPLIKTFLGNEPMTPFRIKRRLDDSMLGGKIPYLFGCYPTDALRDADGNLSGLVMTNRSGRQAVRAKIIIDATDRGVAARIAGATFAPYSAGRQSFTRIVLGGTPQEGAEELPGETVVNSDSRRKGGQKTYKAYRYTLDIPMKDGSWASFAKADQIARDRTWQDGQVDASETLFQIPPDPLRGKKSQSGPWKGAGEVDLDALRSANESSVYVLGGCADISRQAATKVLSTVPGIELGIRVGNAAAVDAKSRKIGQVTELTVKSDAGGTNVGEVGEFLNGLRSKPGLESPTFITSPDRAIPVLGKYDVVVIGGGTGGAPAGIASARAGARTLVVEYLDGLGGIGTMGRISQYYHGNRVGFTKEIDNEVGGGGWNIEKKMEWYRKEIVKAGGDVWYHSMGCGSILKENRFVGVVIATPFGRGVVLANTVIDATGNSVVPACAGVPCQEIGGDHISVQGTGLPTFSPGIGYLNGDWTFNDDDDVMDMWRMFVIAKHKAAKGKPRFQNPYDLGQLITTRARRRIIGDVVITPMDIINRRCFPDTITVAKSNFDNHGFSSHDIFMVTPPNSGGLVGNVPYRALMPKGYDGLLVTGLGISAHGDAMPVLRMQPDVQNQGYAAGHAAAMAAQNGTTVRAIDVKELQKHLVEMAIIPEDMLKAKDSYPISDEAMNGAVKQIGLDYKGISHVLTDLKRALPMLRDAWSKTEGENKLRYAHVLGMLGDGTAVETLIEKLQTAEWDKGWNFRGMGQYGATTSYVDNLVIALGRTRDKRAVDPILDMLGRMTPKSEFSHCRAVAMALESLGDPKAAKPLAELLNQDGMIGHAFVDINDAIERTPRNFGDTSTRNKSLKELVLARALYRCGDRDGLGEKILRTYARDLRGHYATHANAILAEPAK